MTKTRVLLALLLTLSLTLPALAVTKSWHTVDKMTKVLARYQIKLDAATNIFETRALSAYQDKVIPLTKELNTCKADNAPDCAEIEHKLNNAAFEVSFYEDYLAKTQRIDLLFSPQSKNIQTCFAKYKRWHKKWRQEVKQCAKDRFFASDCERAAQGGIGNAERLEWKTYKTTKKTKKRCKKLIKTIKKEVLQKYPLNKMPVGLVVFPH